MKICVIIGASHTAAQASVSLRQGGWSGEIIVIGDESVLPYHRPPLSKDFLAGEKQADDILIRPKESYETAEIEMRGVFYLRDQKDVEAIKGAIGSDKRAVIIGGGYIGLETAASLRKQGMSVDLLEAMPRILQRVTASEVSSFYKRIHEEEGVNIHEGIAANEIYESDGELTVKTKSGGSFAADMVIIGIGVIPNIELAEAAGLEVGNGVVVNEFCQTNDPDVYAAGDVTYHYNPIYDAHIRLESVPNATEQAKTIARHMNDNPKPYESLPWFWSDQFDLKLQIAGLSSGYNDVIIRGDIASSRRFAAFYFKDDQFIAVDAVNSPRDFMFGRMSLTKQQNLDKAKLSNPDLDLKECVV